MRSKFAASMLYLAFAFGSAPPVKLPSAVTVLAISDKFPSEVTAVENDLEMLGVPYETTHDLAQAARLGDWKIVRSRPDEKWELYNLKTDLGETQNVADKNPDVIAKFEKLLEK